MCMCMFFSYCFCFGLFLFVPGSLQRSEAKELENISLKLISLKQKSPFIFKSYNKKLIIQQTLFKYIKVSF